MCVIGVACCLKTSIYPDKTYLARAVIKDVSLFLTYNSFYTRDLGIFNTTTNTMLFANLSTSARQINFAVLGDNVYITTTTALLNSYIDIYNSNTNQVTYFYGPVSSTLLPLSNNDTIVFYETSTTNITKFYTFAQSSLSFINLTIPNGEVALIGNIFYSGVYLDNVYAVNISSGIQTSFSQNCSNSRPVVYISTSDYFIKMVSCIASDSSFIEMYDSQMQVEKLYFEGSTLFDTVSMATVINNTIYFMSSVYLTEVSLDDLNYTKIMLPYTCKVAYFNNKLFCIGTQILLFKNNSQWQNIPLPDSSIISWSSQYLLVKETILLSGIIDAYMNQLNLILAYNTTLILGL